MSLRGTPRRYKIWYDGFDLSPYMSVERILPSFSAPITNVYDGLAHKSGSRFLHSTYGQVSVTIEGMIPYWVLTNMDELNRILQGNYNRPLVISDRPDRKLMCKLDGEIRVSARQHRGKFSMTFISPYHYWDSTLEDSLFLFNNEGRALIENKGSAPTPPVIDVNFTSDSGYLEVVSPNGYIRLGNNSELDSIEVPPSEYALNEEMDQVSSWTRVTDAPVWIPDYNKITSAGTAKHDQWGMQLNPSTLGTSDQWHGHAYVKEFIQGVAEKSAPNFHLKSRVDIANLTGSKSNTYATLIVVMDENNTPIMSTSVYDVTGNKNELVVTFKIYDPSKPGRKHSKIIRTGKLNNLNGHIIMEKSGNAFTWIVHNNATTSGGTTTKELKVGDVVQLKPSARTIYDWDGRALNLDQRVIGQDMKVTAIRTSPRGKYRLSNVRYGYVEGFFESDAIVQTTVQAPTSTVPQQIRHTITDNSLAQLAPHKVFVWQGKWGNTTPYSSGSLNSVVVQRKYTTNILEIPNTFMAGDRLTIDNREGLILLNDRDFEGFVDYDSRFFTMDAGVSEMVIRPSEWANMPNASVRLSERWY